MGRTVEERVAVLESDVGYIKDDIAEIKEDCKSLHGRITKVVENDLAHIRKDLFSDRKFWAAVLGSGGAVVIVLELLIRIFFPV